MMTLAGERLLGIALRGAIQWHDQLDNILRFAPSEKGRIAHEKMTLNSDNCWETFCEETTRKRMF